MKALILIDIQNDFTPGGALAVPDGDAVVAMANRLMPDYPFVVATQDWHPTGHVSFASRHAGRAAGDVVLVNGIEQALWPDHCVQGTPGAALHPGLVTGGIHEVLRKGVAPEVDSYSGFYDNGRADRRRPTGLSDLLHVRGVTEVDLVGLATDYCVKATALDALAEGLVTRVLLEGCRGVDLNPGDVERAIQDMQQAGAVIP